MANEAVPVVQVQRQREVWGTSIPIALVGAPDAGRLREDRHGLSLKAARDPVAMSSPGLPIETANAGDRKLSGQRRRQSGWREAGLRGSVVLVDDPTQHVATADVAERRGSRGHCTDRCGHLESKTTVRPMLVVMPDEVAKDGFEMVTANNERPVETLFPDGPYPALRDRVRTRRPDGCLDYLEGCTNSLLTSRSRIGPRTRLGERTGVRIISVPSGAKTSSKPRVNLVSRSRTRKRKRLPPSSRSETRFRATWVTQVPTGCLVTPRTWTTRLLISITTST